MPATCLPRPPGHAFYPGVKACTGSGHKLIVRSLSSPFISGTWRFPFLSSKFACTLILFGYILASIYIIADSVDLKATLARDTGKLVIGEGGNPPGI